jgi:hypothetical protein
VAPKLAGSATKATIPVSPLVKGVVGIAEMKEKHNTKMAVKMFEKSLDFMATGNITIDAEGNVSECKGDTDLMSASSEL